jgi:DNA-binding transcriptional MerR regulator
MDGYTVGAVARSSGVSVRTLHHYDAIGLLVPSGRSAAGYRLYSEADLGRLRHVLFYRELGFGLDQIAEILADPDARTDDHLRRQHRLLRQRQARTGALLAAVEHEIEARRLGIALTPAEQLEIFGTATFAERAEEAHERWEDTEASSASWRRTAAYSKQDWVATWDEVAPGFARYVHDAIVANADRASA